MQKGVIFLGDDQKITGKMNFAWDSSQAITSSTIDSTIPEQWSRELEDYVKPKIFMDKFIVNKDDLIRQKGDTINVHKMSKLTASGILAEGTSLEGNEETPSLSQVQFTPTKKTNGVAFTEEAEAKSIVEMRKMARVLLGDWSAELVEQGIHDAMIAGVASARIKYGGDATSVFDIDVATDKLTPGLISKTKYLMEAADIPKFNAGDPKEPSAKNEGYYVAVLHPFQIYDLTQHTDYKSAANQAAALVASRVVGPAYQGFDAYWDGVLIYRTSLISYALPYVGYSDKVAKGFMFGPRFLARARGLFRKGPGFIWKERIFGYDEGVGIGIRWYDQSKILNTERLYGIYTAATDLAA